MLSYLITFSTIMAFSFLVSFFKISTIFFFFIYKGKNSANSFLSAKNLSYMYVRTFIRSNNRFSVKVNYPLTRDFFKSDIPLKLTPGVDSRYEIDTY